TGHTADVCYKKHGYPPHYSINTAIGEPQDQEKDSQDDQLGFTIEQHKALLEMIKEPEFKHTTNQIKTETPNNSGNIHNVRKGLMSEEWIIDTGATDHVCHSLSRFQSYKEIKPITIKMPNGSEVKTTISGTIIFSNDFYLTEVL